MSETDITVDEYRNEVWKAMKRAYVAGYIQRTRDKNEGIDVEINNVEGSDYISECFFYYMDGKTVPFENETDKLGVEK